MSEEREQELESLMKVGGREVYLMNLVRVCTSSMSSVVDVNDLVIRD